jgi:hypothetical protein
MKLLTSKRMKERIQKLSWKRNYKYLQSFY